MNSLPRIAFYALLLLVITTVSLAAVACGNGGTSASTSTELVSATETTAPEATTSSTGQNILSTTTSVSNDSSGTDTSSEQVLANGNIKACGIIKDVWQEGGTRKLTIDYVDYLTGAEADAAAVAAGEIAPGQHVEDDYYVRNNNPKLRTFTVSNSVAITLDPRSLPSEGPTPITWAEFSALWDLTGDDAYASRGLWWIERDGTVVVRIDQQFQP